MTTTTDLPPWMIRRGQIIRLLETVNDGLPVPTRREHAQSGFVDGARSRSCPDCLANGRVMKGCETCGGSGDVDPRRLVNLAVTDALPGDGDERDPYAVSDTVRAYGLTGDRHDRQVAIDTAIASAERELRRFAGFRSQSQADEIEEANQHPYPWERERTAMFRNYDYAALALALEALRDRHPSGYHLLHGVYVYGITEPTAVIEAHVERALLFIDARMPAQIRAPGDELHPAEARAARRRAA